MKLIKLPRYNEAVDRSYYVNPEQVSFLQDASVANSSCNCTIVNLVGQTIAVGLPIQLVARLLCPEMELSEKAATDFCQALLKPRKPTARIKKAIARYRNRITQ